LEFSQIQKDIVKYLIKFSEVDYFDNPEGFLAPSLDTLPKIFKGKYSNLELEECARELVSSGVLKPYSFHSYLRLTETFITSNAYRLLNSDKI